MTTPTLVQAIGGVSAAGQTTFTLTLNGVTATNLLVAYAADPFHTGRTFTLADNVNAGNYNSDIFANGGNDSQGIFSKPNTLGGSITVTFTINLSSTLHLIFEEWSGLVTATPFDQSANNTATNANTATSGATGATTQATELVLGLVTLSNPATLSAGSGFVLSTAGEINSLVAAENQVVTSTGAQTATFTYVGGSNTWQCMCATYKAAAGPPPALPSPRRQTFVNEIIQQF